MLNKKLGSVMKKRFFAVTFLHRACGWIRATVLLLAITMLLLPVSNTYAQGTILGTGTGSLIGGDLTDPENDGAPEADEGYNAIFRSNEEPGFGGGEFAFNVFDNILGPGNDKWCCGAGGGIPDDGLWVEAELLSPAVILEQFTVSSANDVPGRDPTHWAILGSNDGENYDTIFEYDGDALWTERLQVIQFTAGVDYARPDTAYQILRMATYNTATAPAGAYFQIGEVEFFGNPGTGGGPAFDWNEDGVLDAADFGILAENYNMDVGRGANGDADFSGHVDFQDFVIFRKEFGGQPAGAAAIPEPGAGLLTCIGLLSTLHFVRRRKS